MPSILVFADTACEGSDNSRNPKPAAAKAPAAAAPAKNVRRLTYVDFGVISEEGISDGFLINMELSAHSRRLSPTGLRAPVIQWDSFQGQKFQDCAANHVI